MTHMSLYTQIASFNSLISGFNRVEESDGAAGFDKISIPDFENDLENQVNMLHNELTFFNYRSQPVIFFERLKADGKKRLLSIFSVRDRVVQSSAMIVLNPYFEKEFEKESFGYRKGFSREQAARRINMLYDEGCKWIVDADIKQYFDSVDHEILFTKIKELIKEDSIVNLLKMWIRAECIIKNKRKKIKTGLLQGSVISPMMANLYLDKFDEKLKSKGLNLVRYADDFIILTKEKPEAEEALRITKELLAELKLEIHPEKTGITNFNTGFKYLGYIFLNSLVVPASDKDTSKPLPLAGRGISNETIQKIKSLTQAKNKTGAVKQNGDDSFEEKLKASELGSAFLEALNKKGITLNDFFEAQQEQQAEKQTANPIQAEAEIEQALLEQEENLSEPAAEEELPVEIPATVTFLSRTMYIQEQGAVLKKEGERIIVYKNEKELLDVPALKISHIIIFGSCTLSPSLIQFCLKKTIPVTLLSSRGKYYGSIESTFTNNAETERLQLFRTLDENFMLGFSKEITSAKIFNQRVLLQRFLKRNEDEKISQLVENFGRVLKRIQKSKNIDDVRGYEGVSAAGYFSVFGKLFDEKKGFYTGRFIRTRRPPLDPVNSLLSFGYTMLAANIYSFLKAHGINPYCGFMHAVKSGHPALASDLMEEFRFLVDTLVLNVLNHKILTKKDFYFAKEPGTPCYLTNNGRKIFIKQFEIKMHQKVKHSSTGFKVDYRRCLDLQVQQLVQFIKGEKEKYEAFRAVL